MCWDGSYSCLFSSMQSTLTGHGLYPSSSGDSLPAPTADARGPSVSFLAPIVFGCKASTPASPQTPAVPPAPGIVSSLPSAPPAIPVMVLPPAEPPPVLPVKAPPPAEPPPSPLLPLLDLSLSHSPVHPAGSLLHMLIHDGPVSPPSPFDHFKDCWDTAALVLLPDTPWGPCSFGSVYRVFTCPRVGTWFSWRWMVPCTH